MLEHVNQPVEDLRQAPALPASCCSKAAKDLRVAPEGVIQAGAVADAW
jgi:hypothetical protein